MHAARSNRPRSRPTAAAPLSISARALHEPLRRQAQRQRAVGEAAGHLQHLGAHRTDVDRRGDLGRVAQHRLVGPPVAGVGIAGRAAPGEQVLHGDERLARAPHRRRRGEAGEAEEHVGPGAEAEEEASAGELLQAGGDHGDLRRMQRHRVEDAGAEMDPRRRRRDRGQRHHTRRVEDVVAEPDLVEARRLGLAGTRHRGVDAAGLARADAQTQFRSRHARTASAWSRYSATAPAKRSAVNSSGTMPASIVAMVTSTPASRRASCSGMRSPNA